MKPEIIYPELSYQITGLCFKVHNDLGRFAKERQYCDRLEQLFKEVNLRYKREAKIYFQFLDADNPIGGNIADFIVEDLIIVECKAKRFVTKEDYYQTQRYLSATKLKLGLIVNFRDRYLKPKRVINYSHNSYNL